MTARKPKAPVDYSKARLYVIRSPHIDKVYIGATTTQLSKRFYEHKKHFKQWTNDRKYDYTSSFEVIHAGNAYIELLKECPCDNKEQLSKAEGEAIRNTANCCNKVIPDRTKREYRETHKEAISQRMSGYYKQNRDKINQQNKEYYEQNKQAINQRRRERRQQKKQQINNEITPPPPSS